MLFHLHSWQDFEETFLHCDQNIDVYSQQVARGQEPAKFLFTSTFVYKMPKDENNELVIYL